MRYFFLDKAAAFSAKDVLLQLFTIGTRQDLVNLRGYLAKRYATTSDKVALFGTGRSALAAAIKSVVPRKSEVLATSLTCFAVVEAIKAAGCQPVFADIDPQTLHYGKKELESALKKHPKVKAVIVQNNLGHPADIQGIEEICKKYNVFIIEDLAHCAGIRYADGREAGTVGAATALSFGKGKSVDTIAGGALVLSTKIPATAKQPKHLPSFASSFRARVYPLLGAMMRGFSYLHLMRYFTALLLKLHLIERSADAKLSLGTRCTCWQAKLALAKLTALPENRPPLRDFYFVKNREELLNKLEKRGFYFDDIWYSSPVSPERYYYKADFDEKECPVAMTVVKKLINVPTHYRHADLAPAIKLIKEHLDEA